MNIENIYKEYLPFITSNYHSLKYLNLPYDYYLEVVITSIKDMEDKFRYGVDLSKELIEKINVNLLEVVKLNINDSNYIYSVINDFIDTFLKEEDKKLSIDKKFDKLSDFLDKINYIPDPDVLFELVKNNKNFESLVSKIFFKHKRAILEGRIYDVIDNDLVVESVNAYLVKNNIEVKDIDDSLNTDVKSSDPMYLYKKELNSYPLLTREEELALARKVKEGDLDARDTFINSNLRLVLSVVGKFNNTGVPYNDMVQDGNIGLIMAVDKFDPEKGFKFSTYATHWIRREILVGMMNKGRTVRIPIHRFESMSKFRRAHRELCHELSREPSIEEIAERMKVSVKEATNLLSLHAEALSLNQRIGGEDDLEFQDVIPDDEHQVDDEVMTTLLSNDIQNLFEKCSLKPKEIDILTKRFNLDGEGIRTLEEIGREYNMSRERVRQIESNAIKKLRNSAHIKDFAVYMDNQDKAIESILSFRDKYRKGNSKYSKYGKDKPVEERKEKVKMPKKMRSVYELFSDYTKEEIDKMISTLMPDFRELLYKRYGNDLEHPVNNKLSYDDSSKFYGVVMSRMKKILKDNREKEVFVAPIVEPILEPVEDSPFVKELKVLEEKQKQEPKKEIKTEPVKEAKPEKTINHKKDSEPKKEVIIRESKPIKKEEKAEIVKSKEENKPLEIDLDEMRKLDKPKEDSLSNNIIETIEELKNTSFGDLLKTMSVKEAVIVSLKFGFVNDQYYSNESIKSFLNVEDKDIREATMKMLITYKEKVLSLVDTAIDKVVVKKLINKTPNN